MLGQPELGAGGGQSLRVGAEMLAQANRDLGFGVLGEQGHRPHELLERRAERPGIRKVSHATDDTVFVSLV